MPPSSRVFQINYVVFLCLLLISKVGVDTKNMLDYTSSHPVASNSSSCLAPQIKYDVFISFRGKDIREGFLSHLVKSFSRKQIVAFVDDKLERGEEISQALFRAIERSLISLIIFSQDYASSHWCLRELVKIVECREKDGQLVIPIFYNVDPSDVRRQKGTYQIAFVEHEEKYSKITIEMWRYALNESANLSGFHSSKFR